MRIVSANKEAIEEVAAVLMNGGVAVIPTDTVYGLAAHPDFPDAVERIYGIKGRDKSKPIALLTDSLESAEKLGFRFDGESRKLVEKHWPGALTVVAKCGETHEGVRVPAHEWTRKLIARCGGALRVTSANLAGEAAAVSVLDVHGVIGDSVDIVVDGGEAAGGVASTVVRIDETGDMAVLRAGTKEVLRTVMSIKRKTEDLASKILSKTLINDKLSNKFYLNPRLAKATRLVAVYFATKDEIDLSDFILTMRGLEVPLCAPRWDGEKYVLSRFTGSPKTRKGPMGIREPVEANPVEASEVDLWIVPGLAFTEDGKRLGYGGGWYDRLLAGASENAKKIGVAKKFQVLPDLPTGAHDIKMDEVVTE